MKSVNFLWIFSLFFYSYLASAENLTTPKVLENKVSDFIRERLKIHTQQDERTNLVVNIRPIDPRLRLSTCANKLSLAPKQLPLQRHLSVKVSCAGEKSWSVFVNATLALEKPVIVSGSSLPKNHVLTAEDLIVVIKDTFGLRGGYIIDKAAVIGQQLKRPIRTGAVVYNYLLRAPNIIKKGDTITVIAQRGALQVTSPGVALSDGSRGQKIRIENLRSSKVIQAKVIGPGTAELL